MHASGPVKNTYGLLKLHELYKNIQLPYSYLISDILLIVGLWTRKDHFLNTKDMKILITFPGIRRACGDRTWTGAHP